MLDVVGRGGASGRPYWPNQYVTVKEMNEIKALLQNCNIKRNELGNISFFDVIRRGHFPRVLGDTDESKTLQIRAHNIYDFYCLANAPEPGFGEKIETVNYWLQGLDTSPKEKGEVLPGGFVRNNVKAMLDRFAETVDQDSVEALGISVDKIKEIVGEINQTILTNNRQIGR